MSRDETSSKLGVDQTGMNCQHADVLACEMLLQPDSVQDVGLRLRRESETGNGCVTSISTNEFAVETLD